MSPITPQQIKTIHTLLPAHLRADAEAKAEFIYSFTQQADRTSTTTLSMYEAEEIIYFLKTGTNARYAHFATFDKDNKQHRYILSLAHQIGWTLYSDKYRRMMVDLEALGGWLRKYGYAHKALKAYTATELPKLVTQLENVLKSK